MNIIEKISNNKNHYTGINKCKYITIHETGNKNKGANALNHAKYINNGSKVTWHYTVDSINIVKHFNDSVQCWHAGDGKGNGNLNSIGIEICVNSDGNMNKAIDNTIELVQYLMNKHNIPITNVVQHNKWSGKNCPENIRRGRPINWNTFINKVKNVSTTPTTPQTDKLYRVQVGAFANKVNAEYLKQKLINIGYSDTFVKLSNNLYKVQVGTFANKNNAENLKQKLVNIGYKDTFII